MKRVVFILLSAVCLAACSKDADGGYVGPIKDGLYVYYDNNIIVSIRIGIKDGWNFSTYSESGSIGIFDTSGALLFEQSKEIEESKDEKYSGVWIYDGLCLQYSPTSPTAFSVSVLSNRLPINLPAQMEFRPNK